MSLQVWLPLNGNLKNNGIANLDISMVGTTIYGSGKTGKESFATGTGYLLFPWEYHNSEKFSFSAWIKPNTPGAWADIFSFGEGLNRIEVDNTLTQYRWYNTSGVPLISAGSIIFSIPNNEWHHITMTADGEKATFYVDGIQTSQYNQLNSLSSVFGAVQTCRIGTRTNNGTSLWKGYINDIRLYDHSLSLHEIERDYCSLLIHYPLRDKYIENTTNLLKGKFDGFGSLIIPFKSATYDENNVCTLTTGTSTNASGSLRSYIDLSKLINGMAYTLSYKWRLISGTGELKPGDWCDSRLIRKKYYFNGAYYEVEVYLPARDYTSVYRFMDFTDVGPDSIYEIWDVQLEKKEHATAFTPDARINEPIYDCSGRGNDSISRGNLTLYEDTSRNISSIYFPVDNAIKIPSPYGSAVTAIDDFSIAMWINLTTSGWSYKTVFTTNYGANASNKAVWLSLNTEGKTLWFYNNQYHGAGSSLYPVNEWHHIVVTYRAGTAQWYMDGEVFGEPITDTIGYVNAYSYFGLGDSYTGTTWDGANFAGAISDFRFYGTAIPATAVKDLYQNSATIDHEGNIHTFEYVEV